MPNRKDFAIRGETRLKNDRLVRNREKLGMTQREMAAALGISYILYNGYENLRNYPGKKNRKALAEFCGCSEDELFPPELKKFSEGEAERVLVSSATVEPTRLLGLARTEVRMLRAPEEAEEAVNASLTQEALAKALNEALSPRDAKVLRLYYGLGGEEEHTLEEVGEMLGVCGQRVRDLRDRALKRLRQNPKWGGVLLSLHGGD